MDRLSSMRGNGFAWGALLACALSASACGEPSCPAGSISINGRCEPAAAGCREGEVENDAGQCVDELPSSTGDAGVDGNVDSDGAVDETTTGDSSVNDAADPVVPVDPLCEGVDCGDHGTCDVVNDEPVCECDAGYLGDWCDECGPGLEFQDGECVSLCEAESAPDCGDNGQCRVTRGAAECMCDHPFAGDACTDCAEGFALQPDGTCEPDCGVCGSHSVCNETLMTPTCECVAGYGESGGECIWVGDGTTGGVVDGALNDSDAWSHDYVSIAGGVAQFQNAVINGACKLGWIEQAIRMPAWGDAEPLILEIDAETTCSSTDPESCPALLVDIGDTVTRLPMAGGATSQEATLTACLGRAAYKEEVLLRVRPSLAMTAPNVASCATAWPRIDSIAIRKANVGECPGEGQTLGNLSSTAGWTFRGTAAIGGGELNVPQNNGEAATLISIPERGGVALRVTSATPQSTVVTLDGLRFQLGLTSQNSVICFPEWTYGSVHRLGFKMLIASARVTGLSVQADPSCANGFDEGFERPLGSGSWTSYYGATVADFAGAHSPGRAWRVEAMQAPMSGLLFLPGYGDDTLRPAFSVWTRVGGSNMEGTLSVNGAGLSGHAITQRATSFGLARVCLGEEWAGQLADLLVAGTARVTSGSGTPTFWIDDMGADTINASACD